LKRYDDVELTLINKLEDPHGFKIAEVGIEEVVQPKAQTTVKFTASQPGAHRYICHIHPPHIGGQMLVLSQSGHEVTTASGSAQQKGAVHPCREHL
jgi:nitrous oxide reductase